jgi:lysophospholipase L1-like esterase
MFHPALSSLLATVGVGVLCAGCASRPNDAEKMLPGAQRIVVLGDSITYGGHYVDFIETFFVSRFPERRLEILNLGLPSDTVSGLTEPGHAGGQFPRPDLHERLGRVLAETKPDVIIACYGMNDGIYLPYSAERFDRFAQGVVRLRERVLATGARLIHVTPPVFDEQRGHSDGYAHTLDRYSDWLLAQRSSGWEVVDVHWPMARRLAEKRRAEPGFHLAGDGVHVGEEGHWIMARQILVHLGGKNLQNVESPAAMLDQHPEARTLLKRVEQKQRLLRDAWLARTGHKRPGIGKGPAFPEAAARANELDQQIRELSTRLENRR